MSRKAIVKKNIDDIDKQTMEKIKKLSKKLDNISSFVSSLDDQEKNTYNTMISLLKEDTNNELTEIEYKSLAAMLFFCDRFESFFLDLNPSDYDAELFDIYRITKQYITDSLSNYRDKTKRGTKSIEQIKSYILELETKEGIKIKKSVEVDEPLIIDIEENKEK